MGLDIFLTTDKEEKINEGDYYESYKNIHSLSRTFCNFMCRRNVAEHEPELDQIGKITGIDISIFYDMEVYIDYDTLHIYLDADESDEEKQTILENNISALRALKGNLEKVLNVVNSLIEQLNTIDALPTLLIPTDDDTIGNNTYFSDFQLDQDNGYTDNNFGQDLRNFKRFLDFAKDKGAQTVLFWYG